MTTPPNQPPHGQPQGFPPPQQPAWGPPSPPQGSPGQYPQQPGYPPPGQPADQPGHPQAYPQPGQAGYAAPVQGGYPQAHPQAYPQAYPQAHPQGYGPPGGHPPYPSGGQQFPPPRKGTPRAAKAVLGVVVLGAVGIVVAGLIGNFTGAGGAGEGDCLKVNEASVTESDVEQVDCGAPEAALKVATRLDSGTDSCPEGDYTEFYSTGGRRSDGYKLCLVLNASEGDCFKQEGTIVAAKTTKVTCDTPGAFRVDRVIGSSDENACASGDTAIVYSLPATTICLTNP